MITASQILVTIVSILFGLVAIVFMAGVYMLPTVWAVDRRHDVAKIGLVNLFLGWCLPVWLALFVWAFWPNPVRPKSAPKCRGCGVRLKKRGAWLCPECQLDEELEELADA